MGPGHEGVRRVDHRRLQRPGEQLGGVLEVPAVELVVAGHEDGGRRLERPPGPAGLLPERGQRAGETLQDDGVEAGDVDAELEGVGGGHAEELALRQRRLQLAPLLGQVPAAVGGHRLRQPGVAEPALGLAGHQLGAAPAGGEGDRPQPRARPCWASSPPTSAVAEARRPSSGSTIGRSSSATARGPRGEPSSSTGSTGRPHSSAASPAGLPMVALAKQKAGSDP